MQSKETKVKEQPKKLRWGVERRMEFIEFRLYWEGRINRKDLIDKFGVSIPQASADLTRYLEIAPGNMVYDTRLKFYFAPKNFKPRFLQPEADRYFANLRSIAAGIMNSTESWLENIPSYHVLQHPNRHIDPERLRKVMESIRSNLTIQIKYQSISTPEPEWRWVTPHALGFDGYRWHIRAFCHQDNGFRDFVLARILSIRNSRDDKVDASQDKEWHEMVDVRIGPHPKLTESQKKVVELDYGLEKGQRVISIRHAFLPYFVKQFGLDQPNERSPEIQQIVLLNREILKS
ncbi:MAG: WYL domain-containing protein [Magnetococcales bacterium]|nr:WYL domain-containing protein [Magnetococcales bacterium]